MNSAQFLLTTVLATFLLVACGDSQASVNDITGKWFDTRTLNGILVEKTEYVLELNSDGTYHMESEQSRKVDDKDYYAEIAGTFREFDGNWEFSDDGDTIRFLMPELEDDERASVFAVMELTISEDGKTLTRSDVNADMVSLVFTRE